MTSIVVLQPMFIPWYGVFEQLRIADVYVHFDDVQYPQGRSFLNRVQLKTPGGVQWLTAPVSRSGTPLIKDVCFADDGWRLKHVRLLDQNLSNAKFHESAMELVEEIYSNSDSMIHEFNINAIKLISEWLGLPAPRTRSSSLNCPGKGTTKLINIVKELGGDTYITGHGAKNYLDYELFEKNGIAVEFIDYNITSYSQLHGEFTPFVTIIDLIANMGRDTLSCMNSRTIPWRNFINDG